ncbi:Protein CBG26832 [Caenorhabditis briggsae]|nr:Protein CBG26832 [Caenorhabditis briggsae]CAS00371.1 Protein CBG26832 [Caenorhabditis briggsae]
MDDLGLKDAVLQKRHTKINDSRVLELIDLCDNALECISNCCQYPQHVQESNALYGKLYKLSNDDNWDCIDRVKKSSALNARTNFFGNHFPECDKNLVKDLCEDVFQTDEESENADLESSTVSIN